MPKYIQIGNDKSAMHVQNNYVNHILHVGFIDNYNYINKVFPYGPASGDFRYDVGKRFNRIVAAINKVHRLPWVIGPIVNLKWMAPRRFLSDVEIMYPHTLGLPYKASLADLNAYLLDTPYDKRRGASLTSVCRNQATTYEHFQSKHILDLERRYVLSEFHQIIPS